jgi:hypothetical protein
MPVVTCPRIWSRENNVNNWLRTFTSKQENNNGERCNIGCVWGRTSADINTIFLVISIPAETPFFSFIDHVIWRKLQASLLASNCTKKTTEMLYLLPTLPSIRFTLRNTAPVLIKLNGPFHFYREWRCIYIHVRRCKVCTCQKLKFSFLLLEYCKIRECYAVANAFTIRYFLVISIPAESPVFSFIDHVIWRKLQASLLLFILFYLIITLKTGDFIFIN